jgi:hypothetical protein
MSTKKLLLRPVGERFFVSISSPLFADGSRSLERFCSGLLFRSLGSLPLIGFSACNDGTKKDPVKLAIGIPPCSTFTFSHRFAEVPFGKLRRPSGLADLKSEHSTFRICEDEQITTGQLPEGL